MKQEQIIVIVFSFLGVIAAIISNYFTGFSQFIIPLLIYSASCLLLTKLVKSKITNLIINSLITFILFWIIVWILLYGR